MLICEILSLEQARRLAARPIALIKTVLTDEQRRFIEIGFVLSCQYIKLIFIFCMHFDNVQT